MRVNLKKHYAARGFDEEAVVNALWHMAKLAKIPEDKAEERIRDILIVMKMGHV